MKSQQKSRENELWIQNKMVNMDALEAFMPEVNASLLEKGYKFTDMKRVAAGCKCLRAMPKSWRRVAEQQEQFAIEAEEKGHSASAGLFYHRAALYYGKAQLYHHQDDSYKKIIHGKVVSCYEKAMACYNQQEIHTERVVLPFGDHKIYGIFQAPKLTGTKLPAVLFAPGMDMIKEDAFNLNDSLYAKRGLCVLSMDGPGQGETRVNGLTVNEDNYWQAGKAFIDWLVERPEVDADKIGVFGVSWGSYNAPMVAINDPRVKACATLLGCYFGLTRAFRTAQPGFRNNYQYMTGLYDDDAFDRHAEKMTLEAHVDRIKIPILVSCGEYDDLCPPEVTNRFFNMLSCPKEKWILENEFHPCGGTAAELYPWTLDWLKDMLTKGCPRDHEKEVFIAAY
jgi:cephalosporin-C deacetylase-like acetyl esterase